MQESLNAVKTLIQTETYEVMGIVLKNTMATLIQDIPKLDADEAEALEEITESLESNIKMIRLCASDIGEIAVMHGPNIKAYS